MGRQDYETETLVAHALRADGFDASEDGTGRGTPLVPVVLDVADTLTSNGDAHSGYRDEKGLIPQAVAFQPRIGRNGRGYSEDVALALTGADAGATSDMRPCIAIQGLDVYPTLGASEGGTLTQIPPLASHNGQSWAVRRLTPRECERLQGFPDDYTLVPSRGKPAADGPRYKALGNSMAVNCMRWIGRRIEMVSKL